MFDVIFVSTLNHIVKSFCLFWFLLDLSQRQVHPHAESSSWQRGPAAQPRHQLSKTHRLRSVCVSERKALPVPRGQRLHLPDHQQCVFMELRVAWGRRPTPERPSFSSSFPLSFLILFIHQPYSRQQLHCQIFIRSHIGGVTWTDCGLIIHTSLFISVSCFEFFIHFLSPFCLHFFIVLSSFPSLLPSFPLSFLQEFRNRNKLGSIAASSSQSVNGAKTQLFPLLLFLVLLFLYDPLPSSPVETSGKILTRG